MKRASRSKGIQLGKTKGGFSAGLREKAKKIPAGGWAGIGNTMSRKKNWSPKVSA
jgi:hypothetical protein